MFYFCFTGNFTVLYCCRDCTSIIRDNQLLQSKFFCFSGFANFLLKYKKFFLKKFNFLKHNKSFPLRKYNKFLTLGPVSSISWNIRKTFFWENIRNFFRVDFVLFFELGLKSASGGPIFYSNIGSKWSSVSI